MILLDSDDYRRIKERLPALKALVSEIYGGSESDDRRLDSLYEELEKIDKLLIPCNDQR
jgi:hypothetical protein